MTLHQLKIFLLVAKEKSIKAAAEQLRTAQPAVSRQLQLLAAEVGAKLHQRIGQGIELTPAGRFCFQEAKSIVSQIENLNPCTRARRLAKGGGQDADIYSKVIAAL